MDDGTAVDFVRRFEEFWRDVVRSRLPSRG
jgi:hypothetical protein